jgi:hypothetical protein
VSNALTYYSARPGKKFFASVSTKKKERRRLKRAGVQNFQSQSVENSSLFQSSLFQAKKFLQNGQKAAHRQAGHGQKCELDFHIRGLRCETIYSRNYYCKLVRLSMLAIDA